MRFTTKGRTLYAIVMGRLAGPVRIKSLGTGANLLRAPIAGVAELGGRETLRFAQTADALDIAPPRNLPSEIATVFRITTANRP